MRLAILSTISTVAILILGFTDAWPLLLLDAFWLWEAWRSRVRA
jgi:hypothetical protein